MNFMKYVRFVLNELLVAILLLIIEMPGRKKVVGINAFIYAVVLIDVIYIVKYFVKKEKRESVSDIMTISIVLLGIWEIVVTKYNLLHPVLFPAPENVFMVFIKQYDVIIENVVASLSLLFSGIFIGVLLGTVLGLFCGWVKRLRGVFYPIASVLAPIPSMVYAPYIIAIMPSFRSASMVIIILGIFWPCFLNTIIRVEAFDKKLLDMTNVMKLNHITMIFSILLPYIFPGIIRGLKVTVTTAFAMLTFAEMMGATRGMGYYIVNYTTFGNYTNVVSGIIVTGVVVVILNKIVELIQKKLIKWK